VIEGEDAAGHVIVDVCFDVGCNGGCHSHRGKISDEVLIVFGNHAGNGVLTNFGCLPTESGVMIDVVG